jgi:DNA primase
MAGISNEAIRACVTMEQVLNHYGAREQFRERPPAGLVGPCPIHKSTNANSFHIFHVHGMHQRWLCFAACGSGDVIDFVTVMEGGSPKNAHDVRQAVWKIAEWFEIAPPP